MSDDQTPTPSTDLELLAAEHGMEVSDHGSYAVDAHGNIFDREELLADEALAREIAETHAELRTLVTAAQAEVLTPTGEAAQLESGQSDEDAPTSTALVVTAGKDAATVKRNMALRRSAALKANQAIEKKQAELQKLMKEQLERMQRFAIEVVEPMKKMVAVLEESIWTINLYMGRDEEVVQLRGGERAPAEEPIMLRQMVLAMDEEAAVAAEDGGITYEDVLGKDFGAFDEWLLAHESHVDQVIPERKAIVALVPRFTESRRGYGRDRKDKHTYFLIRNGDCLFRIGIIDDEFEIDKHLVAPTEEWASFFQERRFNHETREYEMTPLTPGSTAWLRAEEKSDARKRHFMRIALILQGLLDRSTVLHPLPPSGVSFLSLDDYKSGKVQVILDAEKLLGTGRETFREWQLRLMGQLRPGLRIIGAFENASFRRDENDYSEHKRLHPPRAEHPVAGVLYQIERRKGDKFTFLYKRRKKIWDENLWRDVDERGWGFRGAERDAATRASCWILPTDKYIIPYDLAEVEDMERFLTLRGSRSEYADMFPLLRWAIKTKRQEAELEEPFRAMLAGQLVQQNGVDPDDAVQAVDDLVRWWKLSNKHHRPLVADPGKGEDEVNAKAVRMIVAEHSKRLAEERRGTAKKMGARLLALHPDALIIARRRSSPIRYIVLTPQVGHSNAWLRQREYDGQGVLKVDEEWTFVSPTSVSRWNVVHEAERWVDGWDRFATNANILTDPEFETLLADVKAKYAGRKLVAVTASKGGWSGNRQTFNAFVFDGKIEYDADHWLTVPIKSAAVEHRVWGWSRSKDGTPCLEKTWGGGEVRRAHNKDLPWETERLLFSDPKLVKAFKVEELRYEDLCTQADPYQRAAAGALKSIENAWMKRAWDEHYTRFIEDFADPDLWEGHKKTLRVNYPHHDVYGSSAKTPLAHFVRHLIERDIDLHALTVAEMLAVASEHGIEAPLRFASKDERMEMPKDLLDLRFSYTTPQQLRDGFFTLPDEEDQD